MASVSSPGIGSGLDIAGIIDKLVAAERQPVETRLDSEEASIQAEISGLGLLKGAISEFTSALQTLKSTATYQTRQAVSSDSSVLTASTSSAAVPGSYSIAVTYLAQAHKLRSVGFADPTSTVGSGSITISQGTSSFTVAVASGSDTLAEVRDAINAASDNPGVSATLVTVDDGAGGSETRLLLTAGKTGTANALTVTVSDDDGNDTDAAGLSRLVYDPAGSGVTQLVELQGARDALLQIDGMSVTRAENTIGDAIDGVTLTLVAESTTAVTLTVSKDEAAVRGAIDTFVSSYNSLTETLASLSAFDAAGGSNGVLLGDATLRAVQRIIREGVAARYGATGSIRHLTDLGITTGADGKLKIDSTTLDAALAGGLDDVAAYFSGDQGLAGTLAGKLDAYASSSGVIESRIDSLGERVDDVNDRRAALERRMSSLEERLLRQFTAMDRIVSELQTTSDFIARQFEALQAVGSARGRRR